MPLAVKIIFSVFLGLSIVGVLLVIFDEEQRDGFDEGVRLWQIAWRVALIILAWVF